MLATEVHALQVHSEGRVPDVIFYPGHRPILAPQVHSRVIVQHLECAERSHSKGDPILHLRTVRDVHPSSGCLSASGLNDV